MKRNYFFIILIFILASIIDVSFIYPITYIAFTFGFVWTIIVLLAISLPFREALYLGAIQGLIMDFLSSAVFGSYMVSSIILIGIITMLRNTFFKQASAISLSVVTVISMICIYTFLYAIHYVGFEIGVLIINPWGVVSWGSLILGLILQCIVIAIFVRMLSLMNRFVIL